MWVARNGHVKGHAGEIDRGKGEAGGERTLAVQ